MVCVAYKMQPNPHKRHVQQKNERVCAQKQCMKACWVHRERGAKAKGVQAIEGKRNVVKNGSVRARLV
jgi:hypothetical protein